MSIRPALLLSLALAAPALGQVQPEVELEAKPAGIDLRRSLDLEGPAPRLAGLEQRFEGSVRQAGALSLSEEAAPEPVAPVDEEEPVAPPLLVDEEEPVAPVEGDIPLTPDPGDPLPPEHAVTATDGDPVPPEAGTEAVEPDEDLGTPIRGRLRLEDGSPAANRLAVLLNKRTGKIVATTPTSDDGSFAFPPQDKGEYRVLVGRPLKPDEVRKPPEGLGGN